MSNLACSSPKVTTITPAMNRRNGGIFFFSTAAYYLASTVLYVGVVQAALCDRLGAAAVVSNLPAAVSGFANILPVIVFPLIPYRFERSMVVIANWVLTVSLLSVGVSLLLPIPNSIRIATVIAQGLITGLTVSISNIYMYQCLGRGTTVEARARTLSLAFSIGPICAVIASLGTQYVLTRELPYRLAFALLFLAGVPCAAGAALLSRHYELVWLEEKPRSHFTRFFRDAIRSFVRDRKLLLLWLGYFFWTVSYNAEPNISLHVRQVLGGTPQQFSGVLLFLRFGCKSLAGFAVGALAVRRGIRSPVLGALILTGAALIWACFVPGHAYLFAFGLAGAGELAGVYFPNYAISISSPEQGASNLSLLTVAYAIAGFAPVMYGAIAEVHGFALSIFAGLFPLVAALLLVLRLPRNVQAATEKI